MHALRCPLSVWRVHPQRHFASHPTCYARSGIRGRPLRHRGRSRFQAPPAAFWGAWGGGGKTDGEEDQGAFDSKGTERRRVLLQYVQTVDPKVVSHFSEAAPASVVEAMRTTVTNMLGTIPPIYFDVRVSSTGENLAQLMFSVLLTGYMFKSAQYRLDLRNSLSGGDAMSALADIQEAAPPAAIGAEDCAFAPGTQKLRVEGEVLRWHLASDSAETISALDYIHMLERENEQLKRQNTAAQLRQRAAGDGNGLLAYLKSLDQEGIELLTRSASDDVIEAMNTFVHKLLGTSDLKEMRDQKTCTDANELGRLLYWLLVVGFVLRELEVRHEMSSLGLGGPGGHLLPGGHHA